ncbi:MAG: hypothetical protein ACJAS1_004341 [Oleiphilaceae bacterium]|jgi:hypothetical protein
MSIRLNKTKSVVVPILVGSLASVIVHFWLNHIDPVIIATLPDGGSYSGEMVDGKLHGDGIVRWVSGASYKGAFENGVAHGKGHYIYANGSVYEGKFSKGMLSGFGKLTDASNGVYEGEFKADRITGNGHWVTTAFDYKGELKNSQFNGEGKVMYPDDSSYIGAFSLGEFHGAGVYTASSGDIYSGQFERGEFTGHGFYTSASKDIQYTGGFKDWFYDGSGTYTVKSGDTYIGLFVEGSFTGEGKRFKKNGAQYFGQFKNWDFHGKGKYINRDGDVFNGHFKNGYYDGAGLLTLAETIDGIDGYAGVWKLGQLIKSDIDELVYKPEVVVEELIYSQSQLLEEKLNYLVENNKQKQELYFVGIGGDGSQEVFRRETLYAQDLFAQNFNRPDQSIVLINSRKTYSDYPLATTVSIKKTLEHVAKKMDRDNDILFIYLTSHGSKDHNFYLNQPNLPLSDYSAEALGKVLKSLKIRNKIVVISACYSGGFIPKLDDGDTVVITAAQKDKTSFGCADRNEFTYFGEAYFKEGLAKGLNFFDAFDNATQLVSIWEKEESITASEPQILKPKNVTDRINTWFSKLQESKLIVQEAFAVTALESLEVMPEKN